MPDFAVTTAFRATDRLSPAFNQMGRAADRFGNTLSRIKTIAAGFTLGSMIERGISGMGRMVTSTIEAANRMQRLETAFSSVFQGDAANQMQFVRRESQRLGIEFVRSAEAYKGIAAAARGTAISNAMVQETFLGVSEASAALQLTGEQTEGALLAISQIISKGKVSMEELRGQLGERIPGAMQIAARAMGVTTQQFEGMVQSGISAEVFIPRFAAQMRQEFGPAAMSAANSFNAAKNRFDNLAFSMKVNIGSVVLPALNDLMTALSPLLQGFSEWARNNREVISAVVQQLIPAIGAITFAFVSYKAALALTAFWQAAVAAVGWIKHFQEFASIMGPAIKAQGLFAFVTGATAVAEGKLTATQWTLNTAFAACPIVWITLGIMALVAAGYLLYKNWDLVKRKFNEWTKIFDNPIFATFATIIAPFISIPILIARNWDTVKQKLSSLWGMIVQFGGAAANVFRSIGGVIMTAFLFPINMLINGILKLLDIAALIPGRVGATFAAAAQNVRAFQSNANAAVGASGYQAPNAAQTAGANVSQNVTVNASAGVQTQVTSSNRGGARQATRSVGAN